RPEETGLWARTAEEWAAAVRRLAADAALRERLGRAGRRRIEVDFDFAVLAPKVAGAIAAALA
ncbi:MAG TPA: glycosyltransferase, partial [Phycisphaerae bacterium]|nr:glycosyltransferase [Phycisphaerae bacterium]